MDTTSYLRTSLSTLRLALLSSLYTPLFAKYDTAFIVLYTTFQPAIGRGFARPGVDFYIFTIYILVASWIIFGSFSCHRLRNCTT